MFRHTKKHPYAELRLLSQKRLDPDEQVLDTFVQKTGNAKETSPFERRIHENEDRAIGQITRAEDGWVNGMLRPLLSRIGIMEINAEEAALAAASKDLIKTRYKDLKGSRDAATKAIATSGYFHKGNEFLLAGAKKTLINGSIVSLTYEIADLVQRKNFLDGSGAKLPKALRKMLAKTTNRKTRLEKAQQQNDARRSKLKPKEIEAREKAEEEIYSAFLLADPVGAAVVPNLLTRARNGDVAPLKAAIAKLNAPTSNDLLLKADSLPVKGSWWESTATKNAKAWSSVFEADKILSRNPNPPDLDGRIRNLEEGNLGTQLCIKFAGQRYDFIKAVGNISGVTILTSTQAPPILYNPQTKMMTVRAGVGKYLKYRLAPTSIRDEKGRMLRSIDPRKIYFDALAA